MRRRPQILATLLLTAVATMVVGCARSQLPRGYGELRDEVTIAEVGKYYQLLRAGYVKARQAGLMPGDQFVLAVKADETFTAAWNRFLAAKAAGTDTLALWTTATDALRTVEGIARAWVPREVLNAKPAFLGGS